MNVILGQFGTFWYPITKVSGRHTHSIPREMKVCRNSLEVGPSFLVKFVKIAILEGVFKLMLLSQK